MSSDSSPAAPAAKRSSWKRYAVFVCVALVTLFVGCVGIFAILLGKARNEGKPVAEAYLKLYQQKDNAALWKASHSDLQNKFTEEQFGHIIDSLQAGMGPLQSWNLNGLYVNDTTSGKLIKMNYAGTFANGPGNISIQLKNSPAGGNQLKVASFFINSDKLKQIVCPVCKHLNDFGAKFCTQCGAPLGAAATSGAAADTSATLPTQPRRLMKKLG